MKKFLIAVAMVSAVSASPVLAATTATYTMSGSVTAICTVSASGTLSFGTLTDANGATSVQTANPSSADATAFCNQANTTVNLKRTNLASSAAASSGFTNTLLITSVKVVSPQNATGITDSTALAGTGTSAGTSGTLGAFTAMTVSAVAGGAVGGNSLVAGLQRHGDDCPYANKLNRWTCVMKIKPLVFLAAAISMIFVALSPATALAGTTKSATMSGTAATKCDMGTTSFTLTFTVSNNTVTALTFDGSIAGSASGNNKTATTSKTYTFKCNSATKVITLTANVATQGGQTQNYTVAVTGGSTNASASTSAATPGSTTFTPGLISLTTGTTYTVTVTTVTPNGNTNAGNYSTMFTIQ
jgi:hypothetical protein